MKRYIISMAVLLAIAIGAGIVVWYLYQDLNPQSLREEGSAIEELPTTTTPEPAPREPITITTDSLTDKQRKTLEAFGIKGDFTVTQAMIMCAEKEVGTQRFEEIVNGAAPTPLEALSLVPCMKAK